MKLCIEKNLVTIEKKEILEKIQSGEFCSKKSRNFGEEQLIVSLTSMPRRIFDLKYTLYSLITQSLRPHEIVVWLTEEEFPLKEREIPQYLMEWKEYGVSVKWCKNFRSYNKLIPAIKAYPDCVIITADDDIYYPKKWLEILYEEHRKHPMDVIAHRVHEVGIDASGEILPYDKWKKDIFAQPSYRNFLTGVGGVLYPPHVLYQDVNCMDVAKRITPGTDDVWFWGMLVLNQKRIRIPINCMKNLIYVNPEEELGENTLNRKNVHQGNNDKNMKNLLAHYPVIKERIMEEMIPFHDPVIVYGAGRWGLKFLALYDDISFYVDKSYGESEAQFYDKRVYGLNALESHKDTIVVVAVKNCDDIIEFLKDMEVKSIYKFVPSPLQIERVS